MSYKHVLILDIILKIQTATRYCLRLNSKLVSFYHFFKLLSQLTQLGVDNRLAIRFFHIFLIILLVVFFCFKNGDIGETSVTMGLSK